MASQPRLAHILLLGLVAGWLRAAQPRDFTVKDIVYLHPSRVLVELSLPSVPRKNLSFQNSVEFCAGKMKFPYGYACNHNLQATPFPHGFKCFTCERAADNYECNRWAPDVYCPRGTRYCFSQHMMRVTGESVSVTKRCVPLEDCLSTGCTYVKHEEYKICTSCCEGTICNLPLPRNASDAVFTTLSPLSSTTGLSGRAVLMAACLLLGFLV